MELEIKINLKILIFDLDHQKSDLIQLCLRIIAAEGFEGHFLLVLAGSSLIVISLLQKWFNLTKEGYLGYHITKLEGLGPTRLGSGSRDRCPTQKVPA